MHAAELVATEGRADQKELSHRSSNRPNGVSDVLTHGSGRIEPELLCVLNDVAPRFLALVGRESGGVGGD